MGDWTWLGGAYGLTLLLNHTYTIESCVYDDDINVTLDGVHILTYSGVVISNGKIGLGADNQITYFDDIIVRPFVDPEPSAWLGSEESRG